MTDAPDARLLELFARNGSEEAFAVLVQRHIALVHSVALRHTSNLQHAQDITQAVFIILARKADRLGRKTVLPGWLYHTARLTAANLQRAEARRFRREQEAFMQSQLEEPATDALWRELSPQLDEAMAGLGTSERDALVLRYFQNKSMAEVGKFLGLAENTAQKRVSRALEKLRKFFTKRGVSSTTAIIAGAISTNSVQAVPVTLAKTVTAVALANGVAVSGSTLTLIKGALKVMAWTKVKTVIVGCVMVLAAAGTAIITIHHFAPKHANPFKDFEKEMRQKPGDELTLEATRFLVALKPQGRLPGFPDTNVTAQIMIQNLSQDGYGGWRFSKSDGDVYPVSRTLHASKNNDGHFVYYYTVVKASETNDWQLQRAWRTDTNGQVVEEFRVP